MYSYIYIYIYIIYYYIYIYILASTCWYTPTVPKYMFSSSHAIATVNLICQAHLFTFVKHICSYSLITSAQRNSFVEVRLQQCVRYL